MWTTEKENQLLDLKKRGLFYKDIGRIMKISKNTVAGKYNRLKTSRNFTQNMIDEYRLPFSFIPLPPKEWKPSF